MSDKRYDVVILGSGPGGYVAAIRASQLGLKVAIVEDSHLGGICLNWGCIPTKALLRSAEVNTLFEHADAFGFKVEKVTPDFKKIIRRSRQVADQLSNGINHLLKKNKVEVVKGFGKFSGRKNADHLIRVEKDGKPVASIAAPHIIVATGARARTLKGLEPDGKDIWTYKEAMVPDQLPKTMLIVGSGAIGMEYASFYNAMGTAVTVVEVVDRILPVEDQEISEFARKSFEKQGIKIHTNATVTSLKKSAKGLQAKVKPKSGNEVELLVDKAIIAVGINGNTENLNLEKTKIKVEKGHITTNQWCQTDEPGVYAIGDVTGPPWLAHKGSHEGVLAAEHIAKVKDVHALKPNSVPGCTYSSPQIASVGLTEQQAKASGLKIKVGRFPYMGNGKAIAMGESEGLVKTIFDAQTGEFLGAHMVGAEVTELIQGFAIAKTCEATEAELMQTIFPHPTLSELMPESVLDAYDRVIHM